MAGLFKLIGSVIGAGQDEQEMHIQANARKATIRDILNQTIIKEIKIDLQVVGKDARSRPMQGVCVGLASNALLVDLNLYAPVDAWIGKKAHVYFQIKDDQGEEYYDFSVPIIGFPKRGDGYALQLKLPTELHHNQKRMFVRLRPPEDLIAELVLWRLPEKVDQPKSFPQLRDAFCAGALTVEDISAGGVRLGINSFDPVVASFAAGTLGVLHLVARDKGDEVETLNIWLVCECVLIRNENDSPKIFLSFKFRRWAQDPGGENFTWLPIRSTDGVPALTAWIMRRQLDART